MALDVACGTGLSCAASTEIASQVIGIDPSAEMLNRAPRNGHIEYVEASAEDLPFGAGTFDLVTVASAFHWFDRARFLSEARRVLHTAGWLVVYDNFFSGKMKENVEFEHWYRDHYLTRYPSPPRDRHPFMDEEAENHGFRFVEREEYANDILFSIEELACYLETQSNVIAAIEGGKDSLEDVHEWLVGSLTRLFRDSRATFEFGGHIWCLETTPVGVDG